MFIFAIFKIFIVSLFMREWIEIVIVQPIGVTVTVSLFMREWIEMSGKRAERSNMPESPSS